MEEWFEEHDGEFQSIPWPPNSPTMNSFKKRVHSMYGTVGPIVDIMITDTPGDVSNYHISQVHMSL